MKEIIVDQSRIMMHTPEDFGIIKEIVAMALITEISRALDKETPKNIKEYGHAHIFISVSYDSITDDVAEIVREAYVKCGWKDIKFARATDTVNPVTSIHLFY